MCILTARQKLARANLRNDMGPSSVEGEHRAGGTPTTVILGNHGKKYCRGGAPNFFASKLENKKHDGGIMIKHR